MFSKANRWRLMTMTSYTEPSVSPSLTNQERIVLEENEHNQLVVQAIEGDQEALANLFSLYKKQLRAMIAFRLDRNLKGRVAPSDILQEAFMDLAKKLPDFNDKQMSFFVWLRLVTHERLLLVHRQHLGTQKRDPRREIQVDHESRNASSIDLTAHLIGKYSSVIGKAIHKEQSIRLRAVIDGMDDHDREIIAMRVFEGLTNGESSEVLGLDKKTASKRFVRAMDKIRKELEHLPGFKL